MYRPISDYAVIGDCQSAALISAAGSIDWLCLPQFDSPALFLRLLDEEKGGYCGLEFAEPAGAARRYLPATNVLETTFALRAGTLVVTDFMPLKAPAELNAAGQDTVAEQRVVRILQCAAGRAEFAVRVRPTFAYAQEAPEFVVEDPSLALARGQHDALEICLAWPSPAGANHALRVERETVVANLSLEAGQSCALALTRTPSAQRTSAVTFDETLESLNRTRAYWEKWAQAFAFEGEYRDAVLRSALALKLLTFEPTGAIVAAPTTSLPEALGGERNWDYRFSWLRDATFTLVALMNLGYFGEVHDFLHFLRHTVGQSEDFRVYYTIRGGRETREQNLAALDGYRGSRPVRVGNAAVSQQQLDIFGEVINCVYLYTVHPETKLSAQAFRDKFWPLVRGAAGYVAAHWREPDNGIWETRGAPRHFVYSQGSCWLALERALQLGRHFRLPEDDHLRFWQREQDALHDSFVRQAFNPQMGAFVQYYGATELDAAILRLPLMGVIDANDPRMLGTVAQIETHLMRNGLVYRYRNDDGLRGREGAFAASCFWLADNYILSGRLQEAVQLFRHLLSFANDVGLLAEELDPDTGAQLGNFPQAFTHIALINCAVRLAEARRGRKPTAHAVAEESAGLPKQAA